MSRETSPQPDFATVSLGVTDGIQEQLDGFEWDFSGYQLCSISGDLRDIKMAVAILSATLDPQLSPLETIRIARDSEDGTSHLVMVLAESFEAVVVQLRKTLEDVAKYDYELDSVSHRIVPVAELPENGDLIIPVEAMSFLHEPLVFDHLIIETDAELFLHTF